MRAVSSQLQTNPLSNAMSNPNQAELIMFNLGEKITLMNCQCKISEHLLVVVINKAKQISLLVI